MRVTAPQLRTVLLAQAIEHADSGHTLVSPPALEEATRSAVAAARARGVQRVGVGDVVPLGWHVEHVRALDPLIVE